MLCVFVYHDIGSSTQTRDTGWVIQPWGWDLPAASSLIEKLLQHTELFYWHAEYVVGIHNLLHKINNTYDTILLDPRILTIYIVIRSRSNYTNRVSCTMCKTLKQINGKHITVCSCAFQIAWIIPVAWMTHPTAWYVSYIQMCFNENIMIIYHDIYCDEELLSVWIGIF